MSRRQAVSARRYDLELIDREIAGDRACAERLGLVFTVPGQPLPEGRENGSAAT